MRILYTLTNWEADASKTKTRPQTYACVLNQREHQVCKHTHGRNTFKIIKANRPTKSGGP